MSSYNFLPASTLMTILPQWWTEHNPWLKPLKLWPFHVSFLFGSSYNLCSLLKDLVPFKLKNAYRQSVDTSPSTDTDQNRLMVQLGELEQTDIWTDGLWQTYPPAMWLIINFRSYENRLEWVMKRYRFCFWKFRLSHHWSKKERNELLQQEIRWVL